jgi:hypothetical protein
MPPWKPARVVRECEAEAEVAATAYHEAVLRLKEFLRDKGLRRVETPNLVVNWTNVKRRTSFNDKALREAASAAGIAARPPIFGSAKSAWWWCGTNRWSAAGAPGLSVRCASGGRGICT